AQVLVGRCLPYGEGITFWPIVEAVWQAAGVGDDDSVELAARKLASLVAGEEDAAEIVERLAPALGLAGRQAPLEETFWAIRKLLEILARRQPLLLMLDDMNWAEETLLDLIDYLAGRTRGVPLLLICATRPELLERRPSLTSARANASTLLLEPLGTDSADKLMLWQLGAAPLPEALRRSVLTAAEGNPLFVQELVRMLIDDGIIVQGDAGWQATTTVGELTMPPTIQALLAARLDQLEAAERDIAQRASVVGQVFWSGAVRDLCLETARQHLASRLHALVRKELVVPETSTLAAEDAFRFSHILVRDAAYAGLAKRTRAELHERFAIWLETTRGDRAAEHEEIIGYHLEQAAAYRSELGDTTDAQRVAAKASARLARAGRRALASGDLPAAANLLGRAADILSAENPQRPNIRLESIPALVETSRLQHAKAGLAEILAHASEREVIVAARAWDAFVDLLKARGGYQDCEHAVQAWLATCQAREDVGGQATALGLLAFLRFQTGQAHAADEIWHRAVEQAALANSHRAEANALFFLLLSTQLGPIPVPLALERCESIASRPGATRKVKAYAAVQRGVLDAMQGQIDRGRESVMRGRQELEELGLAHIGVQQAVAVEALADDPAAAEAILRPALARLEEIGEQALYSTDAGLLAHVLYAQDRLQETRSLVTLCQAAAADDDIWSNSLWRSALAKVTAREGDYATALQLAEAAVGLMASTDFLTAQADRLVDLAHVHALAGRRGDAHTALAQADALYHRKGCIAALKLTAERRSALGTSPDAAAP
ncbi:MAG: AAA family ATPase, partial [Actinomycetota bacterium]|nr:AAA family ATPase [Actinomycetota bacterium]